MDIVGRLKLFLNQNGIGNSQFADTCAIPRPTFSQLLNGRNKKVSDEIITKIHNAYPSLSIMWLMFGDGEMYVTAPDSGSGGDDTLSAGLVQNGTAPEAFVPSKKQAISFGDGDMNETTAASIPPTSPMGEVLKSMARTGKSIPVNEPQARNAGKQIVNIMVFYSDNSFESFTPIQSR